MNNNNDDTLEAPLLPTMPPAEITTTSRRQVMAMLSNFSTSYNVVNISLVLPILQELHANATEQKEAAVASSLLAGMMLGQVLGGALGDAWSPAKALLAVMMCQVVASLASASLAADNYWGLAAWRLLLGVGAGGVYPLAAVLSSAGGHKDSLHRVVVTFSMQGVGFAAVPVVAVVLLYAMPGRLDWVWRILLALGSVPGVILMFLQQSQLYSRVAPVVSEDQRQAVQGPAQNPRHGQSAPPPERRAAASTVPAGATKRKVVPPTNDSFSHVRPVGCRCWNKG